jgi:transposase
MALALAAHIGPIERFRNARSLSNYFGITPGCRNSGDSDRPGSITKAGHPFIRFLLGQMVLHALRDDPGLRRWYASVKRRRGSKIARVGVMRRLCESIWHMLSKKENYERVDTRRAVGLQVAA